MFFSQEAGLAAHSRCLGGVWGHLRTAGGCAEPPLLLSCHDMSFHEGLRRGSVGPRAGAALPSALPLL